MYWRNGWRPSPLLPDEDIVAQAVEAGVMFRDAPERSHDEWVGLLGELAGTVAREEAGAPASGRSGTV